MSNQRMVQPGTDATDGTRIPQYRKFSDYQHLVPGHRSGDRTHISTFIRWATKGVKGPNGEVIRLRAVRVGAKWLTTDAWFTAFVDASTAASHPIHTAPVIQTPSQASRSEAQIDKSLDVIFGTSRT